MKPTFSSRKKSKYNSSSKGVYKSNLEYYCAEQLTNHGIDFEYEPIVCVLVPDFQCINNVYEPVKSRNSTKAEFSLAREKIRDIKYKPDFVGSN